MEKLRVTAWLQCAVLSAPFLPIDGILQYYAMREKYGAQDLTIAGAMVDKKRWADAPLQRVDSPHGWYYAASFAQWDTPMVTGVDYWNKRGDWDKLADLVDWGATKKVETRKGRYKAYHTAIEYRHALRVWWFVVGDRDEIARLLRFATHIGKKSAQGWGAVLSWKVSPIRYDWSVFKDGRVMRAIPAEDARGTGARGRVISYGVRPSYWNRDNQVMAAAPAIDPRWEVTL